MHRAERETDRLTCRRPTAEDAERYRALLLDPRVGEWLRPPPLAPYTDAEVADRLRRDIRHWEEHDFGPWILLDRLSGALVGRGGLARTAVAGRRAVELPWSIVPERWGQGYATEAAGAALAVARELGLDGVVSFARPENAASLRVMEKIGLERVGPIEHAGLPHLLYAAPATGSARRRR